MVEGIYSYLVVQRKIINRRTVRRVFLCCLSIQLFQLPSFLFLNAQLKNNYKINEMGSLQLKYPNPAEQKLSESLILGNRVICFPSIFLQRLILMYSNNNSADNFIRVVYSLTYTSCTRGSFLVQIKTRLVTRYLHSLGDKRSRFLCKVVLCRCELAGAD